jgi:hypothetical protein
MKLQAHEMGGSGLRTQPSSGSALSPAHAGLHYVVLAKPSVALRCTLSLYADRLLRRLGAYRTRRAHFSKRTNSSLTH